MPSGNPNAKPPEHTKWKPGQSGNPKGPKPGYKHISTWIQEMLNDESFEALILDSKQGAIEFKGAPLKAIIMVAMRKAVTDPKTGTQWAEWLAKHGYGNKLIIETADPVEAALKRMGLMEDGDAGEAKDSSGQAS